MATNKDKGNTGFRNGDLFCFNCGDSHKLSLPMEAGKAAQLMIDFANRHEGCAKTWVEPSPEETYGMTTIDDKIKWWLKNGERGISSETICSVISRIEIRPTTEYRHPYDPDDFRRCYLLLKAIPEFKSKLYRMKSISNEWSALVDNWEKLSELLEDQIKTGKDNGMYDFMKTILKQ